VKNLFSTLALLALIFSCGSPRGNDNKHPYTGVQLPDEKTFGKDWNAERAKRGIPLLDEEMALTIHSDSGQLVWANTEPLADYRMKATHEEKTMYFEKGKPVSEKDMFDNHFDMMRVKLDMHYFYDTALLRKTYEDACCAPWYCVLRSDSTAEQITLAEADSLLGILFEMKRPK